jgi:hypothetical protein
MVDVAIVLWPRLTIGARTSIAMRAEGAAVATGHRRWASSAIGCQCHRGPCRPLSKPRTGGGATPYGLTRILTREKLYLRTDQRDIAVLCQLERSECSIPAARLDGTLSFGSVRGFAQHHAAHSAYLDMGSFSSRRSRFRVCRVLVSGLLFAGAGALEAIEAVRGPALRTVVFSRTQILSWRIERDSSAQEPAGISFRCGAMSTLES